MKQSFLILSAIGMMVFSSCQNSNRETSAKAPSNNVNSSTQPQNLPNKNSSTEDSSVILDHQKTNEATAQKIRIFLKEKLGKEYAILGPEDKKFSFYEIDLNGDNKPEYFINLNGRYFCGSGGCSFYLLNTDFSVNTYFTVTNPPIFRSAAKTDGWNDLILFGDVSEKEGVKNYIHLKYNIAKKRYPNNPSLIRKTNIAPGGHDFVMWHDEFSKAREFTF